MYLDKGNDMKIIIINILILIICLNFIILIFPDGKTQRYCKLLIRIYIMAYILSSLVRIENINLNDFFNNDYFKYNQNEVDYERSIDIGTIYDEEIVKTIKTKAFNNKVNIIDILAYYDNELKVKIIINKKLSKDEISYSINEIAKLFEININNINIIYGEE